MKPDVIDELMRQIPDIRSRILSANTLKPGWDGYGAPPPTDKALEAVANFFRYSHLVPMSDGGLQFEVSCCGMDLELEFAPDGQVYVLTFGRRPSVIK